MGRDSKSVQQLKENAMVLGIDLCDDYTQVSYWDSKKSQPEVIDISGDGTFVIPTLLVHSAAEKWLFGSEALLHKQSDQDLVYIDFINKNKDAKVSANGTEYTYSNLLAIFLKNCLETIKTINPDYYLEAVMITVPVLTDECIGNIYAAFEELGIKGRKVRVQGHMESFIFFAVNYDVAQRRIGLFDFSQKHLSYYDVTINNHMEPFKISMDQKEYANRLVGKKIDDSVKEYIVETYKINAEKEILTPEEEKDLEVFFKKNRNSIYTKFSQNKAANIVMDFVSPPIKALINPMGLYKYISEYDEEFDSILKEVFKTNNVPSMYLSGSGFAFPWSRKALQFLCAGRKVFQSQKLFSKGACYAVADQLGIAKMPSLLIHGHGIVKDDIGIKAYTNGVEEFVPLITVGTPWYNAYGETKLLLDDIEEISFFTQGQGTSVELGQIVLKDLPERPKKTTKIKLELKFHQPNVLKVKVEDLGFGSLFLKTDQCWESLIQIEM